jgi:rSAM/selenodomain-associated transferase 2
MGFAFGQAFKKGAGRVVLIGTDIPEARTAHIHQAFESLANHGLVIGPSKDGGYWLLGMKSSENLFHGIAWGTGRVHEQTMAAAGERGLSIHMLETLSDLDREEQLESLMPGWQEKRPYISVIIPTLNEANHVQKVIQGARKDGVECVVVDGSSTDHTVALAEKAGARVVNSPPGRAVQLNRGGEIARGRVFLFLHADTVLPGDYVHQVFETLLERRVALGAFGFKTDTDQPIMKGIEALTNFRSRFLGLPYGDQGLFLRRSTFRQVNGFPDVPLAEDLFFVRRLTRLGRIRIAKGHVVTSARRWRKVGLLRTTILNQIIVAGCLLGVSPEKLVPFYRKRLGKGG